MHKYLQNCVIIIYERRNKLAMESMIDRKNWNEKVWEKLYEECMNGNIPAIKLYFELCEKIKNREEAGCYEGGAVVIVDDVNGVKHEMTSKDEHTCDEKGVLG